MMQEFVSPEKPLVTILTPTFNDDQYLPMLIESVFDQRYANWQWIIINDGSTDTTAAVLDQISDSRVRVIHQENADQLNAITAALPLIQGDIVTMIHSDDVFCDENALDDNVNELIQSGADGLYSDFLKIDGQGQRQGILHTPPFLKKNLALKTVVLMGNNFVGDPFFIRRQCFESHVIPNYLNKNTIYYFNYSDSGMLNLKKCQPWYAYRVFSENYIHSDIGKFVALSGQFRTVSSLIAASVTPGMNCRFGYFGFRLLRRMGWSSLLPRISVSTCGNYFFRYWKKDLERLRYPEILQKMALAIAHSFKAKAGGDRYRVWQFDIDLPIFYPADARRFYKALLSGEISPTCISLLDQNFDYLVVTNEAARQQLQQWLNFFSLQYRILQKQA